MKIAQLNAMFSKQAPKQAMLQNIDEIDKVDLFEPLNSLLVDIHDKKEEEKDAQTVKKLDE